MRILYLCPDLGIPLNDGGVKGAAIHVRSVVSTFAAMGHDVLVLAASGEAPLPGARVEPIEAPGLVRTIGSRTEPRLGRALSHLWMNVAVESALASAIDRFQPDLVYERYSPFSAAGALLAERLGIAHILEVNAPLAWEGGRYRKQALAEAAAGLEQVALAAAGRIVAVSRELKEILVSQGVPEEKIVVVPNGVDLVLFDPVGETWRPPDAAQTVVGFVGSLRPWHGVGLLSEGFRQVAAARPDLHLLVVGDGPEARQIEALEAELPGRVTRIASVPHREVPRFLRGMDVAVAPYLPLERFYYSPLKILEYMAAGRAVVASAVGQVAEILRDGETALLVPPGDAAMLASAVLRLAADKTLVRRLGDAARRAAEPHCWEVRAAEILALARVAA